MNVVRLLLITFVICFTIPVIRYLHWKVLRKVVVWLQDKQKRIQKYQLKKVADKEQRIQDQIFMTGEFEP